MSLIIIGVALAVLWLIFVVMFKITKGLIHVVLLVALVLIVMHFVKRGP
jgi:hypothetical protein